jgi:hypothetical protein
MALNQVKVVMRQGYDIGMGVAAASGSPMAKGAVGEVTPPQIGTGGTGSFNFRRIDTTEELTSELGISADASGGVGLFSASASFDFAKKCQVRTTSLVVLISAEERFAFEQMDEPQLTPAAERDAGTARFAGKFGEYFVRGMDTGGRFVGVMRIDTKSAQSKQDVNFALSASYGLTVDVEVQGKISNALSNARAEVKAFTFNEGGRVTTRPTSTDPLELTRQMYKAMDEWTTSVREDPHPYAVTLAPYVVALGPEPPNLADLEHQRDVLMRCAKLRTLTMDRLNLLDYMLSPDHMAEFAIIKPPAGPDLPALQASLSRDLDAIADAASFAIDKPKEARLPETFMREIKGVQGFTLTAFPTDIAQHTGGNRVVPNFVGMRFDDAHVLAEAAGIIIEHRFPPLLFDLRVSEQNFAAGLQIPPTVHVILTFVNASLPPPE